MWPNPQFYFLCSVTRKQHLSKKIHENSIYAHKKIYTKSMDTEMYKSQYVLAVPMDMIGL